MMKTHVEVRTEDMLALCDLSEHFIINAIHRDHTKSFKKEADIIASVRHEIAEQNRTNPKQKELPIACKPTARRPKRNDRSHDTKVLVAERKGAPVRKTGKQGR